MPDCKILHNSAASATCYQGLLSLGQYTDSIIQALDADASISPLHDDPGARLLGALGFCQECTTVSEPFVA